jgi:hypothetical protein
MPRENIVRRGATLDIPPISIGLRRSSWNTGRYWTAARLPTASDICAIDSAVGCFHSSLPRRGRKFIAVRGLKPHGYLHGIAPR